MLKYCFSVVFELVLLANFASTRAQDSPSTDCELSHSFKKLEVIYDKTEWFGKLKFRIEGYAEGFDKRGITSTSQNGGGAYNEFKTKYKFTVFLKDNQKKTVEIKGQVLLLENMIIKKNSYFVQQITGIESESMQEQLLFLKTSDATIADADDGEDPWILHIEKSDYNNLNSDTTSFLKNQNRVISIRQLPSKNREEGDFSEQQTVVFLEKDMCLAEVSRTNIWFNPVIDQSLKRILTASIIALES
jgi:hypothetical protein